MRFCTRPWQFNNGRSVESGQIYLRSTSIFKSWLGIIQLNDSMSGWRFGLAHQIPINQLGHFQQNKFKYSLSTQ